MRAARKSHIFEHGKYMIDEEKQERRNKRLQIAYLNKLIALKAGVTVEIIADDGDEEAIPCTSIAAYGQQYRVFRWQGEEHGPIAVDTSRFAVALNPKQAKEQIAHLNKLIEHNAVVSVELPEHIEPVQLARVALYGERQFKVTYRSADEGETSKIIGWNNFFEVSVR